jgi:hemerythrin-like domain-containing protein
VTDSPLADARDMFAVHTMFRREYGAIPSLVRAVAAGDEQRTALVADHVALLNSVLHIHHAAEDEHIWPRLRERCPTEIVPIVDVMQEQHEGIHKGYLRVNETLEAWRASASAEAREALAEAAVRLSALLDEHLALEEERVVPLIERYITAAEYSRIGEEGAENTPPDLLATTFGMVMYEGDPQVIDAIVAAMPAEIQPIIRGAAAAAYAVYAQNLYGTATPPRVTA